MGLGSFVKKAVGAVSTGGLSLLGGKVEDALSTGDSAARAQGQEYMQQMADLYREQFDLAKPNIEMGSEYLGKLGAFTDPSGYNDLWNELSGSPIANSMIEDRERYADQALSKAGLRRSGTRISEAAKIPTEVLSGLMDSIIGNTQNVASMGLGQGSTALGGLNGMSNSLMGAYNIQQGGADRKTDLLGGLFNGGMNVVSSLLSDRRLKKNIQKVGEYGPLNVYSWDWRDDIAANDELVSVMNTGFMADEVEKVFPQHVHSLWVNGFEVQTVNYDGVFSEVRNAV